MKKVIALGASSSKTSINKQLAVYAANLLINTEVLVLDLNDYTLPMYSLDVENEQGIPEEVVRLQNTLAQADAFVVSLAEHNGSYTAAFKNAYDWVSRIEKKVWRNKPMLLMATSPGGRGGLTVLQTAQSSFPHMGANILGSFSLPSFYDNFKDGVVITLEFKKALADQIALLQKNI